jgi:broad specificity phosphatase PhoE
MAEMNTGQRVVIIRHGQTEWSANGRHTSATDLSLTPEGRAQAEGLSGKLAADTFSLVLCSPLRRARETCELSGFGQRAEISADLREWEYGEYEGLTTPEIRERDPDWDLWSQGCPGGELPDHVGRRVDRVLARIRETDGDALVFAHGHVLRVLTARWLEMEPAAGARFKLAAGSTATLGYERQTEVIERWNPS